MNGCVGGVRVVPPFGMYFSDFLNITSLFKMRKGGKEILEWSNSARKLIKILLNPNFSTQAYPAYASFHLCEFIVNCISKDEEDGLQCARINCIAWVGWRCFMCAQAPIIGRRVKGETRPSLDRQG